MNHDIWGTVKARKLGFGMQILEVLAQRKFILAGSHHIRVV